MAASSLATTSGTSLTSSTTSRTPACARPSRSRSTKAKPQDEAAEGGRFLGVANRQETRPVGNKVWSVLFGVVMVGCFVGFAISPFVGWWMPTGVSSHAHDVDFLFDIILYITAFFFVLTEGLLVYFLWKYASTTDGKRPVSGDAEYPGYMKPLSNFLHNQHRVEMAWTLVPSVLLLYIAFAQVNTWANIKYESRRSHTEGKTASLP